jgi:hypothetical protein
VIFAYVTSLRVEGKQTYILRKPKTSLEARCNVLPLGNNLYSSNSAINASLPATRPEPQIPVPLTYKGRKTQQFCPDYCNSLFAYTRRIRKVSIVRLFKKNDDLFSKIFLSDMPYLTLLFYIVSTIIEAFIVTGYQFLYSLVV